MDPDVTDVTEPVQDEPAPAPVPWFRRPAARVGAIAGAVLLALIGGLIWAFSGDKPEPSTALKPIAPSSPTSEPAEPPSSDQAGGLDFLGDLGGSSGLDSGSVASSSPGSTADTSMFTVPGATLPSGSLPAVQLPPAPTFQAAPPQDWNALLQPWIDSQREAVAANLGGAIAGPVVGAAWGSANTAALVLSDLILYAAANPNGGALLSQLQTVLPAMTVPAAASLGAPDFSGLSAAFAAAAATPPIGVPALPQLPALPPPPAGLPTPEQVLGGLAALPAVGLPQLPPPPVGLPTPEQVAGGLFALPAIGLPALPPPPPIGLPQLPPPPPIGLPSIGLPSIGLPSITRLLGLPF